MDFRGVIPGQCKKNLPSALEHTEVVTTKIDKELAAGRIAGPFKQPPPPSQLSNQSIRTGGEKNTKAISTPSNLSHPHGVHEFWNF